MFWIILNSPFKAPTLLRQVTRFSRDRRMRAVISGPSPAIFSENIKNNKTEENKIYENFRFKKKNPIHRFFIQGCIKFPTTWYSSPPPFHIKSWFFTSKKCQSPSPFDILSNSLNIIGKMISLPRFPFFHVIFFSTAMIFPSPLHNLIFFPNRLDKLYLPRELYTPLQADMEWKSTC